jgi:signal transduction histidine kinase
VLDLPLTCAVLAATERPLPEAVPMLAKARLFEVRPEGLRVEVRDDRGLLLYAAGPERRIGLPQTAKVRLGRGGAEIGEVRVLRQSLGLRQILREVAARAAVLALLLVMGTACASALIGRAIAKPIERLTLAASRIAQGERQAVLPRPFGREVRTLTAAVESMRRELEGRHLAERLAVDLSHELKNPVAAIRAAAEVLADGALEEPETARRFIGRILEATQRVLLLVNNLLMLTRLQARGVTAESVDVADLAHKSADAHAAQAHKRSLQLRAETGGPALVRGDPVWLRRALDNLVDNALAFAERGAGAGPPGAAGSSEVLIVVRQDEKHVRVEIKNYGRGIAPEVRDRLFERFVTTRRDTGGSGLGLAIVAAVAEQHGGSVEVVAHGPPLTCLALLLPRLASPLHQIFP